MPNNNIFLILKEIIKEDLLLRINTESKRNTTVEIKEDSNQAKLKKIKLTNFNSDKVFAFKMDGKSIKQICNLFNNIKYINRACDAIIFAEIKNKNYIFICELKSDNPSESDYESQFRSSNSFIDYIVSLCKTFYNIDISNFERKNILFMTGQIKKQTIGNSDKKIIKIKKEYNCKKPEDIKSINKFIE